MGGSPALAFRSFFLFIYSNIRKAYPTNQKTVIRCGRRADLTALPEGGYGDGFDFADADIFKAAIKKEAPAGLSGTAAERVQFPHIVFSDPLREVEIVEGGIFIIRGPISRMLRFSVNFRHLENMLSL